MSRQEELATALAALRTRIERAADAADRDPAGVTLVAVTKTFPADDVLALLDLGVTDLGENRDREALDKIAAVAAAWSGPPPRWHFVGQLQRKKAAAVARAVDVVQSVDRPELADTLARAVSDYRPQRPLDVLLQVGLDADRTPGSAGRGGASPAAVPELARHLLTSPELRLRGVMAVAPRAGDAGSGFARLAEVAAGVQGLAPGATVISAGMSGDLEAAVAHGSTLVRVGTALLGGRAIGSEDDPR